MKLQWRLNADTYVGFLANAPGVPLAFVWHEVSDWRMASNFASNKEEDQNHVSVEDAQIRAEELMNEWVNRHTLGWKGGSSHE
jgi:hypothetical protein